MTCWFHETRLVQYVSCHRVVTRNDLQHEIQLVKERRSVQTRAVTRGFCCSNECKLVIRCRTSSGPCLTLIRVLSRAVYEARDEARRECIIRDTTRARFGNRTATSHDSGSKQITRDGSCGDILTSYFSYRSCPRVLILVPYMPTSVNSYPADTATVQCP